MFPPAETNRQSSALSNLVGRGGTAWRPSAAAGGRFRRDTFPPEALIQIATWTHTRRRAFSIPAVGTPPPPLPFFFPDRGPGGPFCGVVGGRGPLDPLFNY